jgi:halogenation protein CepH
MQGHRVLILEKEKFPRYQIGESLLPSTVQGICRMTGAADDLARAGFTLKPGGTFKWGSNLEPWTFHFTLSPDAAEPTTFGYQVERMKFDQILLDNARRHGAEVREKCTVTDVTDDGDRIRGVRYTDGEGKDHEVFAKYVVDASGNSSRIYRRAGGTRNYSEFFRSLALFGYFEGGKRLPQPNSGNILTVAFDSGWFWYIPLSATLTSVGAVVRQEMASKIQGDREEAFEALIEECPLIAEYLSQAKRITTGEYGSLRVRKDYSYHNTTFWRPGLVLIGDAACFVDPLLSSGVHLATYSALLAARSINSVMAGITEEQVAFREFEARYRREYGVFYEFLMSCYDIHVSETSYFWQAKKISRNSHSEMQAFVELVGGVSSGDSVLTDADALAGRLRMQSRGLSAVSDHLVKNGGGSLMPHNQPEKARQAMRQVANTCAGSWSQFQARSLLEADAMLGDEAQSEVPLFAGGLVTSPDGMFWSVPGEE